MSALLMRMTPPQRRGPRAFRSHRAGAIFVSAAPGADMVAEVSLSNLSADTDEECGLVYRGMDGSNFWAAYVDDGDDLVHLSKFGSGIEYSVATASWTPADTAEIRAIAQADRHRVWVDQKLVIDVQDPTLNTGTKAGLFSRSTTVVKFSDAYAEGL